MGTIIYLPDAPEATLQYDMSCNPNTAPAEVPDERNTPGSRLLTARIAAGVTQDQVAEWCGLARVTVSAYERDAIPLRIRSARHRHFVTRASALLQVTPDAIWGTAAPVEHGVVAETPATQTPNPGLISLLLDILQDPATSPDLREKTRRQIDEVLGIEPG